MTKKRRPRDVIEEVDQPHLESGYTKYPGKELKNVSEKRRRGSVYIPSGGNTTVHTHALIYSELDDLPSSNVYEDLVKRFKRWFSLDKIDSDKIAIRPSYDDISTFFDNLSERKMVIVGRDTKTGKTRGSYILRKTKLTPSRVPIKSRLTGKDTPLGTLLKKYNRSYSTNKVRETLGKIADEYHLQFRELDERGKTIDSYNPKSVRDKARHSEGKKNDYRVGGLESEAIAAGGFFLLSAIFMSFRINGFTILNASTNSIGLLGISFFIVSLFFAILFLRKRRIRKKHVQRNKKSRKKK